MNKMEKAALRHAKDWLEYQRSPQARVDAAIDAAKRAKRDRAFGHSPKCGLLKCHPEKAVPREHLKIFIEGVDSDPLTVYVASIETETTGKSK